MREMLLLLPYAEERKVLLRRADLGLVFRSCGSVGVVRHRLTPNVEGLVCEPGVGLLDDRKLVETIDAYGIKLIVRCTLTNSTVAELAVLSRRLTDFRISLRTERADAIRELIPLINDPDGGPTGLLTSQVQQIVTPDAMRFVVAALVLGRHRVDVPTFAGTLGIACRSLQATARQLALPSPKQLLDWGQACWVVWRMERYGWSPKRAAVEGGFVNSSRMAASLTHITGESLTRWVRYNSVTRLVEFLTRERVVKEAKT
jgi:hypothetical protein